MAGAGYKLFSTGDVLSASDVNTYLQQQTVMVFANAAARTTALSSVLAEGMVTYLKDTDVVEIYTGAAWVSLDDPNAIQNSIVDAKGDLISATADNTPSRLAVGANNTVLTADSSTATGLKWATPASASYAWTTFTPTWYGLTLGNGTVNFAQYLQIDKIVFVRLRTTLGSTSSVASQIAFNAPVTGADDNSVYNGISYINDSSPGATFLGTTQYYSGVIYPAYYSVVSATIQSPNTGATAPMTWANTDWFQLFTWYKAA